MACIKFMAAVSICAHYYLQNHLFSFVMLNIPVHLIPFTKCLLCGSHCGKWCLCACVCVCVITFDVKSYKEFFYTFSRKALNLEYVLPICYFSISHT